MNHPYRTASDERRPRDADVCTCCQRPWAICVEDSGWLDGPPRQRTCPDCHDHGASAMERDTKHVALWRSLASVQQREHNTEAERLWRQISELEQELRDRPEQIVTRYIGQQELNEAHAEAERAFRSRENAWQALCLVRLHHREGQPGRCRCGLHLDRCETAKVVDHYPGLEKWERAQVERLRGGLDHKLPDEHPAVIDPHWRP